MSTWEAASSGAKTLLSRFTLGGPCMYPKLIIYLPETEKEDLGMMMENLDLRP